MSGMTGGAHDLGAKGKKNKRYIERERGEKEREGPSDVK